MYRTLSRWSCRRKAARGVRLPRLIPPSEPTWASSDEAVISHLSPSWHCVLLLFLFLYQTLSFPSVMRARRRDDDNPPRAFWGILQGFLFFPGQNAASGSQHSRCYRPCAVDAPLFMRRWCESMSGDEENSQPVTQGNYSKAIWLQLTWILRVHLK